MAEASERPVALVWLASGAMEAAEYRLRALQRISRTARISHEAILYRWICDLLGGSEWRCVEVVFSVGPKWAGSGNLVRKGIGFVDFGYEGSIACWDVLADNRNGKTNMKDKSRPAPEFVFAWRHAILALLTLPVLASAGPATAGSVDAAFDWTGTYAGVFTGSARADNRIVNSVTDANMPTRIDPDDSFRDSSTEFGWVIGLGVEAPLADAWALRLEGSYLDFGRSTHYVNRSGDGRCGPGNPRRPCPYNVENKLGIVRLAIIHRLGL